MAGRLGRLEGDSKSSTGSGRLGQIKATPEEEEWKRKKRETTEQDDQRSRLAKEQAELEAKKEQERKDAEVRAKVMTYDGRMGGLFEHIGDAFEANSPQDKKKRQDKGDPELHENTVNPKALVSKLRDVFDADTELDKKKRTDRGDPALYIHSKRNNDDVKLQSERLNFSKDHIDERRDYYSRAGLDIDNLMADKKWYEEWKAKNAGKSGAKLALEDNDSMKRAAKFEADKQKVRQIEEKYRRSQAIGEDNVIQQIERNFNTGLGEQIAKLPGSVEAAAGAALNFGSPDDSAAGRLAARLTERGEARKAVVDQKIIDAGYGGHENDNSFVANVSQGAGSLASSVVTGGIAGSTATGIMFGLNAGTDQYAAARKAGKSDTQSFFTGLFAGSAEALLEKVGLDKFMGASGSTIKKFITSALTEGVQEASQSLAQSGAQMTYDQELGFAEALKNALVEGGYGALVGGGAGLAMTIGEELQKNGMDPEQAEVEGKIIADKINSIADEELPPPAPEPESPVTKPGGVLEGYEHLRPSEPDPVVEPTPAPESGLAPEQIAARKEKKAGLEVLRSEWVGKKWNDGMNFDLLIEEDNRTDKTRPGLTRIKEVTDYKDYELEHPKTGEKNGTYRKPQVVLEIVDDPAAAPVEKPKGSLKPLGKKEYDDLVKNAGTMTDEQIETRLKELPPHHQAFVPASENPDGPHLAGVEAIRFYNSKSQETTEKPAPKGSMKLGKKEADVSLVYPETKDLPGSLKENMPSEKIKYELTTTRGNQITVKENQSIENALLTTAIKEAKKNKEHDRMVQFNSMKQQHAEGKQWVEKDSMDLAEYLTGKREKLTIKPFDKQAETSKLTSKELEDVLQGPTSWNRTDVRRFVETVPGLKDKPVLTIKIEDGIHYGHYSTTDPKSGAKYDGRVKLNSLGLHDQRLSDAGVKDGMTIDFSSAAEKGSNKVPAVRSGGTNYDKADFAETKSMKREKWSGSKTPEDLVKLIDNLNKAGQKNAIDRRGRLRSKKAAGSFSHSKRKPGDEHISLTDKTINDPAHYVSTLAHELAHAIEWQVTGFTGKKTYEMLGATSKEDKAKLKAELKAIVDNLESEAVVSSDPSYYYGATEMWARFIETWLMENTSAREIAPTVTKAFEGLMAREQAVRDLYDAIEGNMDKGHVSHTPPPLKDRKQLLQHHLGKSAGAAAWDAEVIRRAEVGRATKLIGKLIKEKFKGVKDSPEALFRAAEAIKMTEEGAMEYGTVDYHEVKEDDKARMDELKEAGYELVGVKQDDKGNGIGVFAKVRYTPEQAREILDALSPEGRQLIEDFNAARTEAKDLFNRDLMKEIYKIDSKLEGWVHHAFKGKKGSNPSHAQSLKQKKAGAQKHRGGKEGYVEDFKLAMEKALTDLEVTKINNAFVQRQLARISKPLAKGQNPDEGWTAMIYDKKYGLRLPGESRESAVVLDFAEQEELEGMFGDEEKEIIGAHAVIKAVQHYQVPSELAEHYRNIRHIPQEVSKLVRFMDAFGKYWTINVLTHPGTTATNFISGALQYNLKMFSDFYEEVLTGNVKFDKTRANIAAPILALTPGGWTKAPDWIWGGYRSTLYGQLANSTVDNSLDKYGNAMLKGFSMVESYWKRAIALSEGANMSKEQIGRELRELDKREKAMIAQVNSAVDIFAYDYDNTPLWMSKFDRKGGKLVKPFITYPYKYTKMLANHAVAPFDQSLTVQERMAKGMALATILAIVAMLMDNRDDESKTPEGTEKTPHQLRPGGRLFTGIDDLGREMFVRTAKYPFFNITSMGRSMLKGQFQETSDILREQYGTIGVGLDIALLAIGRPSEFDQYKPKDAIIGERAATLIPAFRILNDIGHFIDPYARTAGNFVQGVGGNLPIWGDESLLQRLRGKKQELKIPDEPEAGRVMGKESSTTRDVERERVDIMASLLGGVYTSRIDPKEARQQELRESRNVAEQEIRDLLKADPNSQEARDKAKAAGLILTDGTINYYRNLNK